MISFWEQHSFTEYDCIVVGAGLVGLSTAIEWKQKFPKQRVLVLERGLMSSGASSRNAGFACMGSPSELLADLVTASAESVQQLFADRKAGLDLLRQRLGDERIGYEAGGSYDLLRTSELRVLDQIDNLNRLVYPVLGKNAFAISDKTAGSFGFAPDFCAAVVENLCEGAIHTGSMLRSLCDLAISLQIEIKTGAAVERFEDEDMHVSVIVEDNIRQQEWQLRCEKLFLCTNAFTKSLLPDQDIRPGRGQVLITEPIPDLGFKGIFHFDEGYYYFREIEGRILFGGGRNLDFDGETSTELQLHESIQSRLLELLHSQIAPGKDIRVAQRWSGIMAFGNDKRPIVRSFSNRVFGAFRMGGMGVALGSLCAARIASLAESC
jgi:glycine/D-amino acid oxidase-like deaminating enzyme